METDYFKLPPRQPIDDCHVMFVSRWRSSGAFRAGDDLFGFVDSRCNITSNSTAVVASRSSVGYKAWFSRHASPRVGFVFFKKIPKFILFFCFFKKIIIVGFFQNRFTPKIDLISVQTLVLYDQMVCDWQTVRQVSF